MIGQLFGIDESISAKRNAPDLRFFYNIETPVGTGQENDRRSVLLVQYMLDVFLSRYGDLVGIPGIAVTGKFGPETDRAIRAFQSWLQMSPHAGAVPETGLVVPVRSQVVSGPKGSYVPTLLLLNRIWAATRPSTFANPCLLQASVGEEMAEELWAMHPNRAKRFQYAPVEAFL